MSGWRRLALAIQFSTIVPVRVPPPVTDGDLAASMAYLPLVGALLGAVLWAAAWLMRAWPPLLSAAVLVAGYTVLTGALHLDGLMDTVDALASRRPPAEALAIMKDSRVGALGAVGGGLALLIKVAALSALMGRAPSILLVAVPAVARTGILWAVAAAPAVPRPGRGGSHLASRYQGAVQPWIVLVFLAGIAGALLLLGQGWRGVLLAGGGWLVALGATSAMARWLGGMTGDTDGAVGELVEVWGWILAVVG